MPELTPRAAYVAMTLFLEGFYRDTGSDDVGALLGGMSLLPDGTPADPAYWDEWMDCVRRASSGEAGESDVRLDFTP